MCKRLTTEEFIEKAKAVHGDKYDYSKVIYVNNHSKINILCRKHGLFSQIANTHLKGSGCKECHIDYMKRNKVYNMAINDSGIRSKEKIVILWRDMLQRCYDTNFQKKNSTYIGCTVCDEWLLLSNFKKWFDENYIEGYALDKDILVKGNKVYSPNTCCFVPKEINALFVKNEDIRKCVRKSGSKYRTSIKIFNKYIEIGTFNDYNNAEKEYYIVRKKIILEKMKEYYNNNLISKKVYNAIIKRIENEEL